MGIPPAQSGFFVFLSKKEEITVTLQYVYQEKKFSVTVRWTDESQRSVINQEIICQLQQLYGVEYCSFLEIARQLDQKVDNLYQQIHTYSNEHKAISYNPAYRRVLLQSYASIADYIEENIGADTGEVSIVVKELFLQILDKLKELVEVYLADHTYQSKYRSRRRNYEQEVEAMEEIQSPLDFESVILQMTDIARMLEQLTESQRSRLVKHIFLGYTLQEIANQEGVSNQSVSASITAALKKLRSILEK